MFCILSIITKCFVGKDFYKRLICIFVSLKIVLFLVRIIDYNENIKFDYGDFKIFF